MNEARHRDVIVAELRKASGGSFNLIIEALEAVRRNGVVRLGDAIAHIAVRKGEA